ncbi:unnamed protein product [Meloidogyne enterolobii]|uniref:Uncharacterized protein n=1 Tax=Meloidogyne enterolobii TaxID=390850 RepID=A0ACB0ZYE4_MELEN
MALNHNQSEVQVNPLKCKLIDFNTSVFLSNINEANLSLATEDYMAPEIRSNCWKSECLKSNRNEDNVFNSWRFWGSDFVDTTVGDDLW